MPDWVRVEGEHIVCDDADTLALFGNLGVLPIHMWSARLPDLSRPDWCILDLDPKKAPFERVVKLAQEARALCDEIELPAFVKTTGSSGLHVLIPLGRENDHRAS